MLYAMYLPVERIYVEEVAIAVTMRFSFRVLLAKMRWFLRLARQLDEMAEL
jgi:hypothetical protein